MAGDRTAAPTPCSDRAAMRVAWLVANPPSRLADGEQAEADQEDPPPTEQVGQASAEQEQAAEGQGVGGHHPLEADRAEVQVVLDGGQGDVHDRDVEHHHELGQADHDQDHVSDDRGARRCGRRVSGVGRGSRPQAWVES